MFSNLIIIIVILVLIIILAFIYDVNVNKLIKFGKEEEKRLNNIIDKCPSNKDICIHMLEKIKNKSVKIEENKNYENSLYIVYTNKIIIADVKDSYTRVQTIAHECLHSIQSKKILLFNFIFSNIYLLYFVIATLLSLLNIITNSYMYLNIMIIFSYVYYFVRSYLENDAMIKARYLAKDYLEEINCCTKEEIDTIVESYDKLNNIGIKNINYMLMFETLIKTIILAISFIV